MFLMLHKKRRTKMLLMTQVESEQRTKKKCFLRICEANNLRVEFKF